MDLMGSSQSTFSDMVSELGLAAAMGPKTEYTLLAPVNAAFTSELISRNVLVAFSLLFLTFKDTPRNVLSGPASLITQVISNL